MWKDFFYYSKAERRAIIGLSGIGILLLAYSSWQYRTQETACTLVDSLALDSFQISIYHRQRYQDSLYKSNYTPKGSARKILLVEFDPNTADSTLFCQLGLPPFLAKRILNYRDKGGVFRNPEDFSRIYGLTEKQFIQLKPYIRIDETLLAEKTSIVQKSNTSKLSDTIHYAKSKRDSSYMKYPEGTVINLNTADTTQLKHIPGIGSGLARMIVSYRNRLGGFAHIEQLQEIEHLDTTVNRWFTLETGVFRKLRVNHDKLDKLRNHPYMNFYKAKVILEYRRKRGKIKGLPQFSMFQEFTEEDLQKISPYLDFE